jgi:hypothetical protein
MLREREKTAKPSVTWQPGRIVIPRSWDTKIFQPVFCLKLSKGNTANKGCPCYMPNTMQKLPFSFLWVRQTVTTFVSMAPGLWSPAGSVYTSSLSFSLYTHACKHVTTHIHTNTPHEHTYTHTATTQPSGQLCSPITPFFLLSSDSLNPRIICHQRCLVLKEAEQVWGWGSEKEKRTE